VSRSGSPDTGDTYRLFAADTATELSFGEVARNITTAIKDPAGAGIERYLSLEHIEADSLRVTRWGNVEDGITFTRSFAPGHVLFAKRRSYQRKVAKPDFGGVCSGDILVFEAIPQQISARLLPYLVQTDAFIDYAVQTSAGSLSPRTKWAELRKFRFRLPGPQRQEQVGDILEAVDGALWAQEDTNAAIRAGRQAFVEHQIADPTFQSAVVPLGDLIDQSRPICYGILKPGPHIPDGVPIVQVRDYPGREINLGNVLRTTRELDEEYKRSRLAPGDLLLSVRGTVGRVTEVPEELPNANISRDIARIALRADVSSNFVRAVLESAGLQRQMRERTVGLAVQGLNIRDVRALLIPLPPETDQQRLLTGLAAFAEAEDRVDNELRELRALKRRLLDALVSPEQMA
jgi:type I restriction enzyme, S subunit